VLALAEVCPLLGDDKGIDKGFDEGRALKISQLFTGVCEGRISFTPGGLGGFGYDPLFVPIGYEQSFAELGETVKNSISHRAKALEKLGDWLEKRR